jgi:hypothetical protein
VGGHLLGFKDRYGFYVSKAEPYNTPLGSRSSWGPHWELFERKGRQLESLRLKWIGVHHSHVEVKGTASSLQSGEDKMTHKFSTRPIEIIVRVTNYPMNWPEICLSYDYTEQGGYCYDICGYGKDRRGRIRKIKVVEAR